MAIQPMVVTERFFIKQSYFGCAYLFIETLAVSSLLPEIEGGQIKRMCLQAHPFPFMLN